MINPRGPEFAILLADCVSRLQALLQTRNSIVLFGASGTGGLEAAVTNLVSPGDRALFCTNGWFSELWMNMAAGYHVDVVQVSSPWGEPVTAEQVQRALRRNPGVTKVFVTHNETSTGVLNDIVAIAAVVKAAGCLLIVDSVSGAPCHPLAVDALGIDVVITASQKGWLAPPGLTMIALSDAAMRAASRSRSPRWYFDFARQRAAMEHGYMHTTPPLSVMYSLREGLRTIEEEGLAAVWRRHSQVSRRTRRALCEAGLQLVAPPACSSASVTAVYSPFASSDELTRFVTDLASHEGLVVANGLGKLEGRTFRVGHLGTVTECDVEAMVRSLKRGLARHPLGHCHASQAVEKNTVVAAARESIDETRSDTGACLTDLLLDQVRQRPDCVAVVTDDDKLTYRELAEASAAVGAHLGELGVDGDRPVGLFVEPSADLIVGVWGILAAGGAYLPLAPDYPENHLRYMVQDSGATVILCQASLKQRLIELTPPETVVVTVEEARAQGAALSGSTVTRPDSGHLAYVIYTSGSTGRPKGVMIEHRSIVSQMRWLNRAYELGPSKVVLQKTPMSFDAAQWEILASCCGAQVVVGRPGVYRDPDGIVQTIAQHRVTTLQCVPTLLQALLETDALAGAGSLTDAFSGGEVLSRSLAQRFLRTLPGCRLVNLYGPTECTINASAQTVDPLTLETDVASVAIGRPVDGTAFHIINAEGNPAGIGEVGELYVSGIQVARGYLHQPDLTAERFLPNPFAADERHARMYRTGDLVCWNADGSAQFACRADNQVKLRGHRIELDEIRLAIEDHDWIRRAAVVVNDDPASGFQSLLAFIELDPDEAALMDQGQHRAHHQSKGSRFQLKAQLSNPGCLTDAELAGRNVLELPCGTPTDDQRRRVFARKTYRFFEGQEVTRADILRLLERPAHEARARSLDDLSMRDLGEILRYFGQFHSPERLLPKYGYASPGALYATQLYLEVTGVPSLDPGIYYYHPVHHRLVRMPGRARSGQSRLTVHLVGKTAAITPVYQTNVHEVLAIEAGHMAGLFDHVLPAFGLALKSTDGPPCAALGEWAGGDLYLAGFDLVPCTRERGVADDGLDVYVQAHAGSIAGLPAGQYVHQGGELIRISDERILRKHVIAINQAVYDRAAFGISLVAQGRDDWASYVALGRRLQALMMNDLDLGLMPSGYSSRTGRPLPAAKQLNSVLAQCGRQTGPSYFFLGGRVSEEQRRSEGMKEDAVHMQGPAEMLKDELGTLLPAYMVPNRVVVLDRLPLNPSGKVDVSALKDSPQASAEIANRTVIAPRTSTETGIAALWRVVTKHDTVSVQDNFFEIGGNSLMAVSLVNQINRTFDSALPVQVVFEHSTVEELAALVDAQHPQDCSRLVRLQGGDAERPIICWPGLGGYPMNLRPLAAAAGLDRSVHGVQAFGINSGESPYPTIKEMAAADVKAIRCLQPTGPYSLWGYSFGARAAFETAYQLEQAGEVVHHLFLIAPGSPKVRARDQLAYRCDADYRREVYLTILFSVFAGTIRGPELHECLSVVRDEAGLAEWVTRRFTNLDAELVARIIEIVRCTYNFNYTFHELSERRVNAPITIFKARGDDYSFIEGSSGYCSGVPTVVQLDADHYDLLRQPGVSELAKWIRYHALGDDKLEIEAAS